jgi:acetyl-CoA synthetase
MDHSIYPVPEHAHAGSPSSVSSMDDWRRECFRAASDPDGFWLEQTISRIVWRKPPSQGLIGGYDTIAQEAFSWFSDGKLNVTESCLDRHAKAQPEKTAILWEGDEPGDTRAISYAELLREVNRTANTLRELGLKKGERAIIYMGMVPEAAIAMLACARLGAVHSVVFGGFSAEALRDRIRDCRAEIVITQDEGLRGGKTIPLKVTADRACEGERGVEKMLVFRRTGGEVPWVEGRDVWWHETQAKASDSCEPVVCDAEDPLYILYTSGSTGRPKGLVHTCGGYLTFAAYTHQLVFDLRDDDVYACVADIGWVTGHSYIVYGPLANGATTMMFESVPTYPDASRYWDVVERHKVTIFYTAPTAIRALAAFGSEPVTKHDRSSLRVLGTVGEPIDPEAWHWYFDVVGDKRCNVVDTWWQTETGGICISPLAPATPPKPGYAAFALPGILLQVVDDEGRERFGPCEGQLCIAHPWPGQARTVWGDHDRYVATYFATFAGRYFTGDGCARDADGYLRITGRVDDVLNVSGHRLGTAEFEAALLEVEEVAEAAVVGYPHELKGQGVYAYVVLQPGAEPGAEVDQAMQASVRGEIGVFAKVDAFQTVPGLPKTRSGKVMRRILRKVAQGHPGELGDVSTLADPSVVEAIVEGAIEPPGRRA